MRRQLGAYAMVVAVAAGAATSSTTAHAREPVVCPPPDGAPAKRARLLFEEAVQYEASEPDRALALYQCAASLADRAVIELRIGVVAERLQQDEVAIAAFERYLAMAGTAAPDVATMKQHVAELKASHARRAAQARNPDVGPPPPPPAGAAPQTTPPANPEAERSHVPVYLGWGLVAGSGVLAALGGALLVDARAKNDEVHGLRAGTPWASDQARGTYDAATRSQTIGIVCLVVAPALLATGIVFLLTGRAPTSSASSSASASGATFAGAPMALGL